MGITLERKDGHNSWIFRKTLNISCKQIDTDKIYPMGLPNAIYTDQGNPETSK